MQFYKIEAKIDRMEEDKESVGIYEMTQKLAAQTQAFEAQLRSGVYYFVAELTAKGKLTIGAISEENRLDRKEVEKFLFAIGGKPQPIEAEEITFRQLRNLLRAADRHDLIDDDDLVLQMFGLDLLTGREAHGLDISDNLLDQTTKAEQYAAGAKYAVADSFLPELDRIYEGASGMSIPGHPVHYLLCTDDTDLRRELCKTLLQALYENGRIAGRRYNFVNVYADRELSPSAYDALYRCYTGSALLVRYYGQADDEECDVADASEDTIEMMCKAAKKYRNEVLTVFCLPRESTRLKEMLREQLGTVALVGFQEEFMTGDTAKAFLTGLAKESKLRADKQLYAGLSQDKGYLTPELREQFQEWYNKKLKDKIYPQYKSFAASASLAAKDKPKGSAYDELQNMIGLTEAKDVIQKALNYYKLQKIFAEKGLKQDKPAMHMVFTGNPGTAKTSVARLFAQIMRDNGLLSKGHLIEVGRGDLVGKYVGWTAKLVKLKFKEALGGVLFIDEAYSLVDDRSGSFGDEAINTIVQEMENHREELVVIFAGYPKPMEAFLNKNPGLRSRIAFHVPFADYDADELCRIAGHMAKKTGMHLTDGAVDRLKAVFRAAREQPDFGNGRCVRNVLEQARMNQAGRLLTLNFDDLTAQTLTTIEADDLALPAEQKKCQSAKSALRSDGEPKFLPEYQCCP